MRPVPFHAARSLRQIAGAALWCVATTTLATVTTGAKAAPAAVANAPAAPGLHCAPGEHSLWLVDGGHFCGQVRGGRLQGKARVAWQNGAGYEGEMARGQANGQGHLWSSASDYVGQFRGGLYHGRGRLTLRNGAVYEGDFANGQMHGQGTLRLSADRVYEGTFARDAFEEGYLRDGRGSSVYGRFKDFAPVGNATIRWANGHRYDGQQDGMVPSGPGVWTRPDGAHIKGTFSYGDVEGPATVIYPGGARYTGPVRRRQAEGVGTLRLADGSTHTGRFAADLPDGQGERLLPDGTVQAGYWRAGAYVGPQGDGTLDASPQLTQANAERVLYNQNALLDAQAAALVPARAGEGPQLYSLLVAGDAGQEVFRREVAYVGDLLARRFGPAERTMRLVNSRSSTATLPLATRTSIERALAAIAARMDRERDFLLLYITSHGSPERELALDADGVAIGNLSDAELARMLDASGIRNRIVVLSACYAGGFIPALRGERTWVITAASATRTSFGCADERDFTYFGRALFKESLDNGATLGEGFASAQRLVAQWEQRDAEAARKTRVARAARAADSAESGAPSNATATRGSGGDEGPDDDDPAPTASEPQSDVTPAFAQAVDALWRAHPARAAALPQAPALQTPPAPSGPR